MVFAWICFSMYLLGGGKVSFGFILLAKLRCYAGEDAESDAPVYPVVFPSTVQQVLLQFMVEVLAGFHLHDTRVRRSNHAGQLKFPKLLKCCP